MLVPATMLGGCPVSSSESLVSLIVLGESLPEPEQESAEGHSFGGSLTLAKSLIAEILWLKVTKTSSQYARKLQALNAILILAILNR